MPSGDGGEGAALSGPLALARLRQAARRCCAEVGTAPYPAGSIMAARMMVDGRNPRLTVVCFDVACKPADRDLADGDSFAESVEAAWTAAVASGGFVYNLREGVAALKEEAGAVSTRPPAFVSKGLAASPAHTRAVLRPAANVIRVTILRAQCGQSMNYEGQDLFFRIALTEKGDCSFREAYSGTRAYAGGESPMHWGEAFRFPCHQNGDFHSNVTLELRCGRRSRSEVVGTLTIPVWSLDDGGQDSTVKVLKTTDPQGA